eukprot:CAMPEP_0118858212 /NCGR_PEP_ID=MMETSP1163-20130328/4988_1 /TAXON_ID=124430 /ORGANISM="Phaeomonas parva, Strain CCMP2877" /LENGTH=269 /DNA_ID=CAMNT_0006791641 /DNA_START=161 /DNA_END=970 /DNA_ORIENTATION=-
MSWFFGSSSSAAEAEEAPAPAAEAVPELHCRHFFLNILVLNKEEVIQRMAEQKVEVADLGAQSSKREMRLTSTERLTLTLTLKVAAKLPRAKGLQKIVGRAANRKVTDEKFLSIVATKFCQTLPSKMAERGIICGVIPRFIQKTLIVIEMKITNVDTAVLLESAGQANAAQGVTGLLSSVSAISSSLSSYMSSSLDNTVAQKVEEKLFETVPVVLEEKMAGKGLRVEACAKRDVDQAMWFYECLKTIDAPSSPSWVEDAEDEEIAEAKN